jgi:hypothetical protein
MELWWSDNGHGKTEALGEQFSPIQCAHYKSLMDWSGTELSVSIVRSWHQTSTIAMATYIIKINKNWECLLHSQK